MFLYFSSVPTFVYIITSSQDFPTISELRIAQTFWNSSQIKVDPKLTDQQSIQKFPVHFLITINLLKSFMSPS